MKLMRAATETVRQETFQGRDFTVVPVIAIVEGVLQAANSPQPELVRASEFEPASWNGRPITFGHPAIGETLVSASASPEVFEKVAVGTIFNAIVIDGTKLRVEAWIDNEKVEEQGDEAIATFARILAGEVVEVSTGYFADSVEENGKFDGEEFTAVQSDIKPDHLAILVGDQIGACSLEDGCGTNRVNKAYFMQLGDVPITISTSDTIPFENLSLYDFSKHPLDEDEDEEEEDEEDKSKSKNKKKKTNLRELLEATQLKDNGEISDMDIRGAISSALEAKGESFWSIIAVFQSNFVFEKDFGTLERREFSIADGGEVTISNEGDQVRPVTEFVLVKANQFNEESKVEDKEKLVNDLIANEATQFSEEDREFLAGLDEVKLGILSPIEVEEEEAKGVSDGVKAEAESKEEKEGESLTTEQYIEGAPPEIKEVLNQGIRLQKEQRDNLTKAIISNSQFDEEDLKGFSIEHLEKLAATAAPSDHSIKGAPVSNLGKEDDDAVPAPLEMWPRDKKSASAA